MILFGLWGILRWDSYSLEVSRARAECSIMYYEEDALYGTDLVENCNEVQGRPFNDFETMMWFSLISGIGAPILFYAGLKLYSYLFTSTEE